MKLKSLMNKNTIVLCITIILAILLYNPTCFNFLMETILGRFILLLFIILISYNHKIIGLLAVLIVILAVNKHNFDAVRAYNFYDNVYSNNIYNVYEGFDGSGNVVDSSSNAIVQDKVNILQAKEQLLQDKLTAIQQNSGDILQNSSSSSSTETFKGSEGFGTSERELTMLRGKPSNSIPVFNNLRNQSGNIDPSDKSVFSSSFASF
jgi:hypothetical protein